MAGRQWDIEFHPAFQAWTDTLRDPDLEALVAALQILRELGPSLGRPLVDRVVASQHPNMKELRPGSTGRTEIRVLLPSMLPGARCCLSAVTRARTGEAGTG